MRYSCDHCKYKTDRKLDLARHIKAKHLPHEPNLNKCNKCGKKYSWRTYLLKHLKLCGQPKDFKRSLMHYKCDQCGYKTDYKSSLSAHIVAKHLQRDLNANKCSKCMKSFSKPSSLKRHSKICSQSRKKTLKNDQLLL